jgi:hypothetical protein
MKPVEVIESVCWINKNTGLQVSPYGAIPWTSEADKPNWTLKSTGWTIAWDNGTVGNGKPPFPTKEAAEAWLSAWKAKRAA